MRQSWLSLAQIVIPVENINNIINIELKWKRKNYSPLYMKSFINLIIVSIYEIMKINKKIKMEKKIIGTQE